MTTSSGAAEDGLNKGIAAMANRIAALEAALKVAASALFETYKDVVAVPGKITLCNKVGEALAQIAALKGKE